MRTSYMTSPLAIATVLSLLAAPVLAQNASTPLNSLTTTPATTMHTHHVHKNWSSPEHVEARIKTLHDKLGITAEQEDQWKNVADTMRQNEQAIHNLIKERHENGANMSAVDDLRSYQSIAKEHVEGLDKLIPVFESLYDTMSDTQKANADKVFGKFEGHDHHHARSGK